MARWPAAHYRPLASRHVSLGTGIEVCGYKIAQKRFSLRHTLEWCLQRHNECEDAQPFQTSDVQWVELFYKLR